MKCPKCQQENPGDSTFCGKCGTRLKNKAHLPLTQTVDISQGELQSGSSLAGRYEIIEELGRGGMGKVYRAEDTNLSRHVAIKVLPDEFSDDAERLARFKREAKLLASLNHSNIATIYGLEEHNGRQFLILELVEGRTLSERLKKGPLPFDETLHICRQIAEGLEAAHEKGIIHRDLKPANVMVTPEGNVKILDFGLAKAFYEKSASVDISPSPAITDKMTASGIILGTASYMSPEQAKGRAVDKRTDIWAFGCILFECLTGNRVFPGESITEIVATILKSEPVWTLLPDDTPSVVISVLRRCLRKDPDRRLHDIADARIEILEETDLSLKEKPQAAPRRIRPTLLILACLAALIFGVFVGPALMKLFRSGASAVSSSLVRSSIKIEPSHRLGGEVLTSAFLMLPTRTEIAISSDGRFIVYSAVHQIAGPQVKSQLFLRRFDQLKAEPISGTEGGTSPFLSPDDNWLGFWADERLMKVPIEGGIATTLCEVKLPFGFSWGTDNRIVFADDRDSGLLMISAEGGEPEELTVPDRSNEEFAHRLPHFLPDGKRILFTIKRHPWDLQPRIAVLERATRKWQMLLEDGADAHYLTTGHLAFLQRGTLMVVPFDPDRLEIIGQPVPVIKDIEQALNTTESWNDTAAGQFCISTSGSLIYAEGGIHPPQENSLVWVDDKGKVEPVIPLKAEFFSTRLSPDGRRIAYSLLGMEGHLWIHDLVRGTDTRLTTEGMAEWALWTPGGDRLAFDWLEAGPPNIFWQPLDGSTPMERLTSSEYFQWPGSWSPDGETLAIVEEHEETGRDIYFLNISDRRTTPFLNSRYFEGHPEFSPNGKWIAYVTDETGRMEVYVQHISEHRGRLQISHDGGGWPIWDPNSKQLFYRSAGDGNQVWVVDVQMGEEFSASRPRLLIEMPGYSRGTPVRTWDISLDGRRFLAVKLGEIEPRYITELILVQNWLEELKRLVPAEE